MTLIYYGYAKCGTCRKAKKWLEMNGLPFEEVDITKEPPSAATLKNMIETSGLDIKKFFNVSGKKYRELGLKDQLPTMSDEEKIELLSSDGMLLKRPIVASDEKVTVGFKEESFENTWTK
ncbi:arsenate reductase family protein [Sporosarcina sp. HYO08]|uniref:arsenate reductase family protein n=1 Tax=Sporosarcina sp. HYO08 TaxID=1759557 RepID=UPI000799FA42|nr:arsenate reductase family protein [Sporosarcina sp. HYO08]KXH79254.1 hypothetical protein AU377_11740 [Sporosarcina sp. HYO08]